MCYTLQVPSLAILLLLHPAWSREGSERQAPQPSSPATLTVTALDRNHRPVADLRCNEFQVFDGGKPKPITGCSLLNSQRLTVVMVWDLLNIVKGHRGYSTDLVTRSIRSLQDASSVYLYLLSNSGQLYPVRSFDATETPQFAWPQQIQAALDAAFDKIVRLRPIDFQNEGIRVGTTFQRLAELHDKMKTIPGPKTILWLTTGVSNLMLTPYGCRDVVLPGEPDYVAGKCVTTCGKYGSGAPCIDYTPFLKHFSADLQSSGTSLKIVEETPYGEVRRADGGSPHDTLEQLAVLTGARLFQRSDIDLALSRSLLDSLSRYQISFVGANDGSYHQLRIATTRSNVSIEGPKQYFAGRP